MKRTTSALSVLVAIAAGMAIVSSPAASQPPEPQFGPSVSRVQAELGETRIDQSSVVRESTGFDWGDAIVGASAALLLVSISLVVMFVLRRRGRRTVKGVPFKTGVLSIAVCALLVVGVATGASGQSAAGTTLSLKELEKGSTFTHIRNTRTRSSNANTPGDVLVFTNPLADASGKRIGKFSAACTTTTGARDFRRSTVTCAGVITLPGGTFTVQANVRPSVATTTGAITGGTGSYARARGTFTSTDTAGGAQDTLTYTID